MSDDRPAIQALNEALIRHNIPRDAVSMLNQIKLDILYPQQRAIEALEQIAVLSERGTPGKDIAALIRGVLTGLRSDDRTDWEV